MDDNKFAVAEDAKIETIMFLYFISYQKNFSNILPLTNSKWRLNKNEVNRMAHMFYFDSLPTINIANDKTIEWISSSFMCKSPLMNERVQGGFRCLCRVQKYCILSNAHGDHWGSICPQCNRRPKHILQAVSLCENAQISISY